MKDTGKLFGTLGFRACVIVLALAVGIGFVACDNGTTSGGGGGGEEGDIEVSLLSVTPNPNGTTTELTLDFDKAIDISAADVKIAGTGVTKGTSWTAVSGTQKRIGVNVTQNSSATVSVTKTGYRVAGTKSVQVYYAAGPGENDIKVKFEDLKANGNDTSETTWKLFIKLDKRIPGLTAENIKIRSDGSNRAPSKGGLYVEDNEDGSAAYTLTIYHFGVTNNTAKLTVGIEKVGYYVADTQTVDIYAYPVVYDDGPEKAEYSVSANDNGLRTSNLTIVFDVLIPNLRAEDITFVNVEGAGGVSRGALRAPSFIGGEWHYILEIGGDFAHRAKIKVVIRKNGYKITTTPADQDIEFINIQSVNWYRAVGDSDSAAATTTKIFLSLDYPMVIVNGDVTVTSGTGKNYKNGFAGGPYDYTISVSGFIAKEEVTVTIDVKDGYRIWPTSSRSVTLWFAAPKANSATALAEVLRSIPAQSGLMEVTYSGNDLAGVKNAIDMATPDGVTINLILSGTTIDEIKAGAFSNCEKLESLQLPSNVTTIETGAFTNSALKELTVGGALTSAPLTAFTNMANFDTLILKDEPSDAANAVVFPNTVKFVTLEGDATVVGGNFNTAANVTNLTLNGAAVPVQAAFSALSGVTELTLGKDFELANNVAITGTQLNGLNSLMTISVDPNNTQYSSDGTALLNKLGTDLISYPKANISTFYELPSTVTTIQAGAIANATNITSLTIPGPASLASAAAAVFPTHVGFDTLILKSTPSTVAGDVVFPATVTKVTLGGSATVVAGNFIGSGTPVRIPVTSLTLNGSGVPTGAFFEALPSGLTELALGSGFTGASSAVGVSVISSYINKITVDPENTGFMDKSGILFTKDGKTLVKYPAGIVAADFEVPTGVEKIENSAFIGSNITELTFATTTLKEIGTSAFEGCEGLSAPTFPTNTTFTKIGDKAFAGCDQAYAAGPPTPGFVTIVIPNNVTSLGESAFEGCDSLTTVTLGTGITAIKAKAFAQTTPALTTITINGALTELAADAFPDTGLTTLTLGGTPAAGTDPVEFPGTITTLTLTDAANVVAANFTSPALITNLTLNGSGKIIIPTGATGLTGVTTFTIGEDCDAALTGTDFDGMNNLAAISVDITGNDLYDSPADVLITKVAPITLVKYPVKKNGSTPSTYAIPGTVVKISDGAFAGAITGFTTIAIPTSVTEIGNEAFKGCTGLGTASGSVSFTGVSTCSKIGDNAFQGCSGIESLVLPASVVEIGAGAFAGCNNDDFEEITINGALTKLGVGALPDNITKLVLGGTPTAPNGTPGVVFPDTIETLTLKGTTTVVVSNFADITKVTELTLDGSVKTLAIFTKVATLNIGGDFSGALTGSDFDDLSELTSLTAPTTGSEYSATTAGVLTRTTTSPVAVTLIKYPSWITDASYAIATGVTAIGDSAFKGANDALETLTFTSVVVASIGKNAFEGTKINTVAIPATVTIIDEYAFKGAAIGASGLTFAGTTPIVETIGKGAFEDCTALTTVAIPASVKTIGENAFKGSGLSGTNLSFVASSVIESIGNGAFANTAITSITISSTTVAAAGLVIGSGTAADTVGAFEGITTLTGVTFSGTVNISIGVNTFKGCTSASFTTLEIPAIVTSIGAGAFAGTKVATLTLKGGSTAIAAGAFGTNGATAPILNLVLDGTLLAAGAANLPATVTRLTANITQSQAFTSALITELIIGEAYTNIANTTFIGLSALVKITFTDNATTGFNYTVGTRSFRLGAEPGVVNDVPTTVTMPGSGTNTVYNYGATGWT